MRTVEELVRTLEELVRTVEELVVEELVSVLEVEGRSRVLEEARRRQSR